MEETYAFCKHCGKKLPPDSVCVDCTLTDLNVAMPGAGLESGSEVPGAHLVESHSQTKHPIRLPKSKIGRDPTNQIIISDDPYTSRFHAWVCFEDGHYFVEDLGSTNGTLLNGSPLTRRRPLVNGDRVRIGRSDFVFETEPAHAGSQLRRSSQVAGEG